MSQRTKVTGTRSCTLWLLALIAIVLIVGLVVSGLILYPQLQEKREAQARLAEAERHYQAGIAFQNVGDWEAAEAEFKQVVTLDANYEDVQARLAEVRARVVESEATATAVALAQTEQARADAQATATAQAQATAEARANAIATAEVAPTATGEALEAHYQKGLGYMNMRRWEEAKAELEQVFEADPNYKEVQVKLAEVEAEIAKLTPTVTPTAVTTPTPIIIENIAPQGEVTASSVYNSRYTSRNAVDGIVRQNGTGEWASRGEQAGAWLRITFHAPRHISKIVLYDRPNNALRQKPHVNNQRWPQPKRRPAVVARHLVDDASDTDGGTDHSVVHSGLVRQNSPPNLLGPDALSVQQASPH